MTESEYDRTLDELDRLINDPTVPMQPERIWSLLAEVSHSGRFAREAWVAQPGRATGAVTRPVRGADQPSARGTQGTRDISIPSSASDSASSGVVSP